MRLGGRLHRFWLFYGESGFGQTTGLPMWVWRPYCWLRRRHEDDSYGACVICRDSCCD